ncbi:MAG: DinB family protein [Dehalococcoidia bacterium]
MPDVLDGIVEENARARAELLEVVDAIPAPLRLEPTIDGWSVKDVIVNIAAWQDGYAHALELMARGERPKVPDFEDDDLDAFNARRQQEAAGDNWERTMVRLRAARERHDAAVRGLRVLEPDRYAEGKTARRLADAASHDREHIEQIAAWRRSRGV